MQNWIDPNNICPACDSLPAYVLSAQYTHDPCDLDQRCFWPVFIDDVPVGTGRIDEHGNLMDVEWSAVALARLGLIPPRN